MKEALEKAHSLYHKGQEGLKTRIAEQKTVITDLRMKCKALERQVKALLEEQQQLQAERKELWILIDEIMNTSAKGLEASQKYRGAYQPTQ